MEHVGEQAVFVRVSKGDNLLFRKRDKKGKLGKPKPRRLTPQSVALLIQSYSELLKIDADQLGGHSLRRGWLTAAAKQDNADIFKMAEHSRHKSMDVVRGYVDDAKKLEDHAGAELL